MRRQQQNESFCNRLNRLKESCGVSALQLSREVNVSHVAVGKWLCGSMPRPGTIKELSVFFGCSVDYLLHGKGDAPEFLTGKTPRDFAKARQSNPVAALRQQIGELERENRDLRKQLAEIQKVLSPGAD